MQLTYALGNYHDLPKKHYFAPIIKLEKDHSIIGKCKTIFLQSVISFVLSKKCAIALMGLLYRNLSRYIGIEELYNQKHIHFWFEEQDIIFV